MKTCPKCSTEKPLEEFHKDKSRTDGRQGRCRECNREYRQANAEKIAERKRVRHAENPHVAWVSGYRTRAKKFGLEPVVEHFTKDDVIAVYGSTCFHCIGGEFEELDHHPIPVRDAGPHTLANIKPSCSECNQQSWREDTYIDTEENAS